MAGKPLISSNDLAAARALLRLSVEAAGFFAGFIKAQSWSLAESSQRQNGAMPSFRWELFSLRSGLNSLYRLVDRQTGDTVIITPGDAKFDLGRPPPTPEEVKSARNKTGLSQGAIGAIVDLHFPSAWADYERGAKKMDPARWELLLLKVNQHPFLKLESNFPEVLEVIKLPVPKSADIASSEIIEKQLEAIDLIHDACEKAGITVMQLVHHLDPTLKLKAPPEPIHDDALVTVGLIKETMADAHLQAKHLLPRRGPRRRPASDARVGAKMEIKPDDPRLGPRQKVAVNPETGQGWAGRGTEPDWIKMMIDNGRCLNIDRSQYPHLKFDDREE